MMLDHIERLFALDVAAQPAVEQKARLLLLDTLGCMLAGRAAHEVSALEANLTRLDPGAARFPGGNGVARSAFAALAAIAACWDEACEGLARAHGRPGVPVIATCLALADIAPLRYGELLAAIVTGYEIGARAGEALRIRPGMHVDAGWPALGAAAGAARMLRLSSQQTHAAIELAACQLPFGLYLPIKAGANGRNTYLGHAAWLGLHSALAIASGIAAPAGAVNEHARLALDLAAPAFGDDEWRILEGYLKPYAAVRHVHYGAAAAASLRRHVSDSRAIRAITLDVYDEALTYCGNRAPQSAIQAQFSLSFGLAAMLRFGRLDPDAYRAPLFDDVELRRLEALIDIRVDSTYAQHRGARVTLHTDAGTHTSSVDAIAGDPAHPLPPADVHDKFLRYATASLPPAAARHLADAVLHGALDRPVDFLQEVQ